MTIPGIAHWIADWRQGALDQHFKSQEIPDTNGEVVVTIVGKNFNELVRNSGKHVLLLFFAPWCTHCQELFPVYQQLAEQHAGNENLVIA